MANQINLSVNVSQNNDGFQLQTQKSDFYSATGSLSYGAIQLVQSGSWQPITSSITTLAYLYLFNNSTSSMIAISTNSSSAFITDWLQPQTFCLKAWNNGTGTFYASSSIGNAPLQVLPIPA